MKTLFVSDLDGTLMRRDKTLSEKTVQTLNRLIENGVLFTYATARSIQSAMEITGKLKLKLPVITRNGTVLADNSNGRMIQKALFTLKEINLLKTELPELEERGFVSSYFGDEMYKLYCAKNPVPGLQNYIEEHKNDSRMKRVENLEAMFEGEAGYVTLVDDESNLRSAYERMRKYEGWECVFQKDAYDNEFWLEICPENCTKAKAILALKKKIGADKLVVFGDSINDLPMFEIADEACAVGNAIPEAKARATKIIGKNDDDSVACYIEQWMQEQAS